MTDLTSSEVFTANSLSASQAEPLKLADAQTSQSSSENHSEKGSECFPTPIHHKIGSELITNSTANGLSRENQQLRVYK
jgi:hypothetical protein